MKVLLILIIGMTPLLGFAEDESNDSNPKLTEASVGLNCDSQVPGSTCPAKYSSKVGLFTDTRPSNTTDGNTPKPGDK